MTEKVFTFFERLILIILIIYGLMLISAHAQTQGLTEDKVYSLLGRCITQDNLDATNLNITKAMLDQANKNIDDLKKKCGKSCEEKTH